MATLDISFLFNLCWHYMFLINEFALSALDNVSVFITMLTLYTGLLMQLMS